MTSDGPRRIIVAITGASGPIYGIRLLERLAAIASVETHLIVTSGGRATIAYETSYALPDVLALADHVYPEHDLAAAISSGSFLTDGMIVAPCSIKTLSGIATCHDSNLVVRAADVVLKERRRLVLMVRESPFHLGHLRLMTQVTEAGAVVAPPLPAFYYCPQTIADLVDHSVSRVMDLFGISDSTQARWTGPAAAIASSRAARRRADGHDDTAPGDETP